MNATDSLTDARRYNRSAGVHPRDPDHAPPLPVQSSRDGETSSRDGELSSRDGELSSPRSLWRALYHFNLYRLFLSGGLLTLSLSTVDSGHYGERSPEIFLFASLSLAAFSLLNILSINAGRPGFRVQASWQITIDIVLITLLMHSSGGTDSGLGLLLLVSIAGCGVVLPGRVTLAAAALATLAIMSEAGFSYLLDHRFSNFQPMQLATLGIAFFTTAFVISFFSARVHKMESLAETQAADVRMLSRVNANIVRQLETGVLLVGDNDRILLANEKSRQLLGVDEHAESLSLEDTGVRLNALVSAWRAGEVNPGEAEPLYAEGPPVIPRILSDPDNQDHGLLVFLHDETARETRAQEMKLAAIGRLTAAIAHEIRNPLSAVSHASDLLAETELEAPEQRLIEIIQTQTVRINNVIQSVLHLGRRGPTSTRTFELKSWLTDLAREICSTRGHEPECVAVQGEAVSVVANSDQLMQIINNLLDNALRNAHGSTKPHVNIRVGLSRDEHPVIELADTGPGIDPENVHRLFEPFFTTRSDGTGLGLYISRQLAEANGATLKFVERAQGTCFRIEFHGLLS